MGNFLTLPGGKIILYFLIIAALVTPGFFIIYNTNSELFFKLTDFRLIIFSFYKSIPYFLLASVFGLFFFKVDYPKENFPPSSLVLMHSGFLTLTSFFIANQLKEYLNQELPLLYIFSVVVTSALFPIIKFIFLKIQK